MYILMPTLRLVHILEDVFWLGALEDLASARVCAGRIHLGGCPHLRF